MKKLFLSATCFLITSISVAQKTELDSSKQIDIFNKNKNNSIGILTCVDKGGNVSQIKLSTVEYIIILIKNNNKKDCSFSLID